MKVNKNGDLWWICSELVCLRPSANVGFISVVDWEKTLNLCVYVVRLIYSVGWWGWIQTVLLLITCQMRRINFFICIVLSSGESNWPFNSHQRGNISPSSPSSHRLHNLGHLPASHPAWNNFSGGIFFILLKYFCLVNAWISSVWECFLISAVVVIVYVYTGLNKTRLSNGRQVNASFLSSF